MQLEHRKRPVGERGGELYGLADELLDAETQHVAKKMNILDLGKPASIGNVVARQKNVLLVEVAVAVVELARSLQRRRAERGITENAEIADLEFLAQADTKVGVARELHHVEDDLAILRRAWAPMRIVQAVCMETGSLQHLSGREAALQHAFKIEFDLALGL